MHNQRHSGKGRYYTELIRSLAIASSIFAIISMVVFFFLFSQFRLVEKRSNEGAFINQLNTLNIAYMSLSQMLRTVDGYYLDQWIDSSPEDPNRYYSASVLYRWLSSNSFDTGDIAYSTALISDSADGMTITTTGTSSFSYYIDNFTNLGESAAVLSGMLESRLDEIVPIGVYSDGGALTDAYFAIPYFSEEGNYMLFVARFYVSKFLILQENQFSAMIGPSGQSLINRDDSQSSILSGSIERYISERKTDDINDGSRVFIEQLAGRQWSYVTVFESADRLLLYPVLWLMLIVSYASLMYFLVFKQAERLYSPLSFAIKDGVSGITICRDTDEMAILRERNRQLASLSADIRSLNEEMRHLEKVRENRNIIEGNILFDEDSEDPYYVSLLSFTDNNNGSSTVLSLELYLQSKEEEGIGYVPYGLNRIAVLFSADSDQEAKDVLLSLLHELPADTDVKCVLSNMVRGRNCIRYAYSECLRLMEYASILHSYQIIMPDDIQSISSARNFSYSAEDEQLLIEMIASGNPQARDEFSEILSRNRDGLSLEARHSLALCFLSTIARLYSKLRKSPEEMIGHKIDFAMIASDPSADSMMAEIQDILYKTIDSMACRISATDNEMLMMMKKYIHENYMRNIGLQNLADKFNITPKYCGMLFSRLSSENFKNYLNQYRIDEAKEMIRKNPAIKVQDLAFMVGFNSPTSFIRVFSRYTGMTPKAYADSVAFSNN